MRHADGALLPLIRRTRGSEHAGAGAPRKRRTLSPWVAACTLASASPAMAGTGVPDDQLWTELDLVAGLSSRFSVTGIAQLRLSETLSNPTLTASGVDFNYQAGDWTVSAGYRHQVTGNRIEEHPNVTQVALLMGSYARRFGRNTLAFRVRVENTISASSNPWRLRLRGEYRWATERAGPVSYLYVNDEGFYQASNNDWFRNRAQAGLNLVLGARSDMRVYYQRQDSNNSHPGAINALGVLVTVAFK